MHQKTRYSLTLIIFAIAALVAGCGTTPDTRVGTEQQLQAVQTTLANFQNDPNMTWFRDNLKNARAVIISPRVTKAGFVFGGSGGEAVVLSRHTGDGRWIGPAFYNMGAGSVGFQIGVELSEVVMLVMSEKGLNALLSPSLKLGGDASIAAGPVGVGKSANVTADVISFARSKGAYAGLSLEGAAITPDTNANKAFYGKPVSPVDILVRHNVESQASQPLRQSLGRAGR